MTWAESTLTVKLVHDGTISPPRVVVEYTPPCGLCRDAAKDFDTRRSGRIVPPHHHHGTYRVDFTTELRPIIDDVDRVMEALVAGGIPESLAEMLVSVWRLR